MKATIIGYGSIGRRHAEILSGLGLDISIVSSHAKGLNWPTYDNLSKCLDEFKPEYIIVCNETSAHAQTIKLLSSFNGKVLIEKPISNDHLSLKGVEIQEENFFVAYNLRFHPCLVKLREILKGQKVLSTQVYVGQYLPTWRPDTDYRKSYSASKAKGGGVLLDLSHELDYLLYFFGKWESLTSIMGKLSHLEIDSEDSFSGLIKMKDCPLVSLNMNYLDRFSRREVTINTDEKTIRVDLVKSEIIIDKDVLQIESDKNASYRSMHQAVLSGQYSSLCSFEEGIATIEMIESFRQSSESNSWVMRKR